MLFDRYADISRIIYLNFKNLPNYPDFNSTVTTPIPEELIDEEETKERVGGTARRKSDSSVVKREEGGGEGEEEEEDRDRKSGPVNYNQVEVVDTEKKKTKEEQKIRQTTPKKKQDEVEEFNKILAAATAEWEQKEAEMKDLDRLVNALLQEASQIPDIPYHAREDGLPFRYCPEGDIVEKRNKLGGRGGDYSTSPNNVSSTSKQPWSPIKISSSPPTTKAAAKTTSQERAEYLPKNWNQRNVEEVPLSSSTPRNWSHDGRRDSSPQNYRKESVDGNQWSKVTVEHETKPLVWTSIPPPNHIHDSSSSRNGEIQIPINRASPERSAGIPIPIVRQQSRDWDVFEEVKRKEQELEDWIRSSSSSASVAKEPRKQVKYSRSFSADNFGEQGSDEWLSKQMAKLQLKRSSSIKHTSAMVNRQQDGTTPAWLMELKQRNLNRNATATAAVEKEIVHQVSNSATSATTSSNETVDSVATTPTPRFPACPPTPYMNKSAANRRMEGLVQKSGRSAVHTFAPRSNPVTDDDTEDEEEIAKIMFSRKQEEDLKFTVDTSCNWYKPSASREETISALAHRPPGTFIIRNSNSFPGAYGLAIKVDESTVRHFLIEPTRAGVRLRGSAIEPVFGSLSALVYAHTIQPLALPVKLRLHTEDNLLPTSLSQSTTSKLLSQGAACQLLFMGANNVEMLTGTEAIQRSVTSLMTNRPTLVNLRLSKSGLVLTDVLRENFFRHHHPLTSILHAGLDPLNRSIQVHGKVCKLFGIVVSSQKHNSVLVLSEYEEGQPAIAIVSFILRVIQWRNL